MEKFSQFRDRGSGISPFIPVSTPTSRPILLAHSILFLLRLPFFITFTSLYFLFLQHLPLPAAGRKVSLWSLMVIPGIWWVDLQLDGVKRGTLAASQPASRVPHPGSIIAASFTSPIDALYLAAVFDPIFTASLPDSRKVRQVGLAGAMMRALSYGQLEYRNIRRGGRGEETDLRTLLERYPDRVIVVFPECATTNGKGILPFSPSLLSVPKDRRIFPVSIRYTPPDITTPVPGAWLAFLWKLLSQPTHCIRVRIAEGIYNVSREATNGVGGDHHEEKEGGRTQGEDGTVTPEEQHVLDKVAEALARLGRNKRVGLTLRDKAAFTEAWNRARK